MHYLSTFFLLLLGMPVWAQVEIGVKGGATLSWIHTTGNYDDPFELDQKTGVGFYIGATTDIMLGKTLWLTPELYFTQRGTGGDDEGTSLNYLTLPVLLSYEPFPKFGLQAGGALSYLLAYRVGGNRIRNFGEEIDFGVLGGMTYQLTDEFRLSARYYLGLSSMNSIFLTNQNGEVVEEIKNLNRSIEIGIVYYLQFR